MRTGKIARRFVILLAVWLIATTALVTVAVWNRPQARAVILMGWGLILLWIGVGGLLMCWFREGIGAFAAHLPLGWRWKFILFSTMLALGEEAITTTMTNLAPAFGVRPGEAFITA
jgi:hypothetical protein